MTTKKRLKEFVSKKGYGQNKFEEYIGIANGYLASKSQSITSDTIEKVLAKFPELNLYWLITGQGEMLKSEEDQEGIEMVKLRAEIESLKTQLAREKELVSQFMGKIEPVNKQTGGSSEAQTGTNR